MAKKEKVIVTETVEELKPLTLEDTLEYHLSRCDGNTLSKQQVRAIFQSLFRA